MIRPPSRICRAASCVATNTPRTLTAISFSKSSNGNCSIGAKIPVPALFTRMSMPPKVPMVFATANRTASVSAAVRLAVAKTIGTFGGIDILVNNAGTGIFAPIEQFPLEDFEKLIAINVRGLFVATQEAARHLREGGRIIHIGSTNSERMPFVGGSVYALTKGAVAGFTKRLARDLGPRGITVNNVQPGPIDTDMNPADSDFAKTLVPITALQRYGNTDEIASFVAYLASPEASYITGASLLADGGFAA